MGEPSIILLRMMKAPVYLSLTGYRNDNFDQLCPIKARITAKKIGLQLVGTYRKSPVNVIYEDPKVSGLLYIGTDHGYILAFNDGANWAAHGCHPKCGDL